METKSRLEKSGRNAGEDHKMERQNVGMETEKAGEKVIEIKQAAASVIVGKERTLDHVLAAILAGGHVLLEDLPGTGKTLLAKTLAKTMDLDFGRIQFTPDLMPSDVTGVHFYNQKAGEFVLRKGPVFSHILLADEINRATPRTQSSLLEAMEERQATIDGETMALPVPFFVIATENPVESAGTFPLPEAQLDRFLMKLGSGLPGKAEELQILERFAGEAEDPLEKLSPVCGREELKALQTAARQVYVHPQLMEYMVELVQATRDTEKLSITAGVSPRGSLSLLKAARALALVRGRAYVTPEDVQELAVPVLAHRLVMPHTYGSGRRPEEAIRQVLKETPVPTEEWKQ